MIPRLPHMLLQYLTPVMIAWLVVISQVAAQSEDPQLPTFQSNLKNINLPLEVSRVERVKDQLILFGKSTNPTGLTDPATTKKILDAYQTAYQVEAKSLDVSLFVNPQDTPAKQVTKYLTALAKLRENPKSDSDTAINAVEFDQGRLICQGRVRRIAYRKQVEATVDRWLRDAIARKDLPDLIYPIDVSAMKHAKDDDFVTLIESLKNLRSVGKDKVDLTSVRVIDLEMSPDQSKVTVYGTLVDESQRQPLQEQLLKFELRGQKAKEVDVSQLIIAKPGGPFTDALQPILRCPESKRPLSVVSFEPSVGRLQLIGYGCTPTSLKALEDRLLAINSIAVVDTTGVFPALPPTELPGVDPYPIALDAIRQRNAARLELAAGQIIRTSDGTHQTAFDGWMLLAIAKQMQGDEAMMNAALGQAAYVDRRVTLLPIARLLIDYQGPARRDLIDRYDLIRFQQGTLVTRN